MAIARARARNDENNHCSMIYFAANVCARGYYKHTQTLNTPRPFATRRNNPPTIIFQIIYPLWIWCGRRVWFALVAPRICIVYMFSVRWFGCLACMLLWCVVHNIGQKYGVLALFNSAMARQRNYSVTISETWCACWMCERALQPCWECAVKVIVCLSVCSWHVLLCVWACVCDLHNSNQTRNWPPMAPKWAKNSRTQRANDQRDCVLVI